MEHEIRNEYYYAVYLYKNELYMAVPLVNETPMERLLKLLGKKGDRAIMLVFQTKITEEQYELLAKAGKKNDRTMLKALKEGCF